MAVRTAAYKPILFSEKLEPNDVGKLDLCRACALLTIFDTATNGEFSTNDDGSKWGKRRIKRTLEKMRAATGLELRGSYNTSHMDEFAKGAGFNPRAWVKQIVPFKSVVQGLKDGYAYTLSGDVRGTPAGSPLRKWVNPGVGHELALIDISDDGERIQFIDPMTPHGTKNYARWAPKAHFKAFAKAFMENGKVVSGRIKKGYYTAKAKAKRAAAATLGLVEHQAAVLRDKVRLLNGEYDTLLDENEAAKAEVALLENQLELALLEHDEQMDADLEAALAKLDTIRDIVVD
jgi:hypothetical protein